MPLVQAANTSKLFLWRFLMVASVVPSLRRVNFDLETFASVYYLDRFSKQWETVSLSEIDEEEAAVARKLLGYLKGDSDIDVSEDNLLLIKTENDTPVTLYGASVFRASDENEDLVVKFGNNIFPLTFDAKSKEIKVGSLTGEFVFLNKETADKKPYQVLVAELNPSDDPYLTYPLAVSVQKGLTLTKPQFNAAIASGAGVAQFFSVPGTGGNGGTTYNLEDLELGEYPIAAIHQYEKKDKTFGLYCYVLELEGGAKVWVKGGSQNQLVQTDEEKGTKSNKRFKKLSTAIKSGSPYKLKISKKESYKKKENGVEVTKWSVTNVIMPGVTRTISPDLPLKQIEQAKPELPEVKLLSQTELIQWAVSQGLTEAEANSIAAKLPKNMSREKKQDEFFIQVGQYLKSTIQTVDIEATSEIAPEDLPY